MNAFGVHGCSAITALTAQNTLGVQASEPVSAAMLQAQLGALEADFPPAAIKTGMLGSAQSCKVVVEFLAKLQVSPLLVCDPVLKSTSGSDLLDPGALDILIHGIFPMVEILTPNRPEVARIIGREVQSAEDAAERLLETGVHSVLIKGGHTDGAECRDYWTDGQQSLWLSSPRIDTRATHGTGCILSSAIASALALGQDIPEAVDLAFITTPAKTVPSVLEACGEKGVKGVVLITSGFSETDEAGKELERDIVNICREKGLTLIGPNTMGICNPHRDFFCIGTSVNPMAGSTAIVSQSGNLGVQLLAFAEEQAYANCLKAVAII